MDEGALRVHQVELVVQTTPGLGDGGGVAQHAHGTLDLSEIPSWYHGRRLVVNADFEACWAPIDELDRPFCFYRRDCGVDVFGDDVTAVKHAAGHVLPVSRVTVHQLVSGFEACIGDLCYTHVFVIGLLDGDDWRVCGQWEVDSGIRHQVGLELG